MDNGEQLENGLRKALRKANLKTPKALDSEARLDDVYKAINWLCEDQEIPLYLLIIRLAQIANFTTQKLVAAARQNRMTVGGIVGGK